MLGSSRFDVLWAQVLFDKKIKMSFCKTQSIKNNLLTETNIEQNLMEIRLTHTYSITKPTSIYPQ